MAKDIVTKGRITGFSRCGYGERYVVECDMLPVFVNQGWNSFVPREGTPTLLEIEGPQPSVDHESFGGRGDPGDRAAGRFKGWIDLRFGGEREPVFIAPNRYLGQAKVYPPLYRISG